METTKQQKYNRLIQKEISIIFQNDFKHYLGNTFITVTGVRITPDLLMARIHISMFLVKETSQTLELLNSHKNIIRKLLGQRIKTQVRVIPQLFFFKDDTDDNAEYMDKLIQSLEIPSS
ncbi:MAG: 30S ribosome-binding factor RbfA [Chitinophagaceae bacterium]|nr:30S ribosome-binding factor RbfA [Chitinophagaceae bacterium]